MPRSTTRSGVGSPSRSPDESVTVALPLARLPDGFARRARTPLAIAGSLASATALALVLAGRRHDFETAFSSVALPILGATVLLQVVALLARSEAWHLSIEAAGGTIARRLL